MNPLLTPDYRQPRRKRPHRLMAWLALLGLSVAALLGSTPAASAAAPLTYGDFSMMFQRSYGTYANGTQEWAWSPTSATESQIYWGATWNVPGNPNAPEYREVFTRDGDWVRLVGWFDNGAFYRVKITQEWQAAADCRTGRTALAAGGAQHYVRWTIPTAAYCLYATGTITEELAGVPGKRLTFEHQQVWTLSTKDKYTQWESWSDDKSGVMTLGLERTQVFGLGKGPAQEIRQTVPSVWSAVATSSGKWG